MAELTELRKAVYNRHARSAIIRARKRQHAICQRRYSHDPVRLPVR
jgi:hypothetical protein